MNKHPHDIGRLDPTRPLRTLRVLASKAISAEWDRLGGNASELGPALSDDLREVDSGYLREYAGGTITSSGGATQVRVTRRMTVHWAGIECLKKQENSPNDEMFGVVTRVGGYFAGQEVTTAEFGVPEPIDLGDRRLYTKEALLYEGPPVPMVVVIRQSEHDSGDTSRLANDIADAAHRVGVAVLAQFGVDRDAAEAFTLLRDLVETGAEALLELFGTGNDDYAPVAVPLSAAEVAPGAHPVVQPPVRRPGEAPLEAWTHSVDAQGTDDGGDVGLYRHYLLVRIQDL